MEQLLFPAIGMTSGTFALPQSVPWSRMAPVDTSGRPIRYWQNMEPPGMVVTCANDMHAYLQLLSNSANPGISPVTGIRILSAASAAKMRDRSLARSWTRINWRIILQRIKRIFSRRRFIWVFYKNSFFAEFGFLFFYRSWRK